MPDLSQNLGNLRSWNLIGKENNYFIFENKNIPYVIHVKFDYLNSSYLNLLLYKKDKDKANLIIRITAINNVDHIKKMHLDIIDDFLNDLDFYYLTLKRNEKTNLIENLITTFGVNVTAKQEITAVNILKKLSNADIKKLIRIFS